MPVTTISRSPSLLKSPTQQASLRKCPTQCATNLTGFCILALTEYPRHHPSHKQSKANKIATIHVIVYIHLLFFLISFLISSKSGYQRCHGLRIGLDIILSASGSSTKRSVSEFHRRLRPSRRQILATWQVVVER